MEMQDWAHVTQGINAIGQTINRRNQDNRANAEADRQREINTQTATAYEFFMKNPNAWDFDAPEKQPQPTAIDSAAGNVPKPKPLPIEGFHPEAIAAARISALRTYTDRKQLSRENLMLHAEQGKVDAQNFKKGIGQAMALFAAGDELATKQMIAESYNNYYSDAHTMEIDDAGEIFLVSPTGKRKHVENPDLKAMLDNLGTVTDADHVKARISRERTLTELDNQALTNPGMFRDQKTGRYVYQFNVHDLNTGKLTPKYSFNPTYGAPGWTAMTEEDFRGLQLEPVARAGATDAAAKQENFNAKELRLAQQTWDTNKVRLATGDIRLQSMSAEEQNAEIEKRLGPRPTSGGATGEAGGGKGRMKELPPAQDHKGRRVRQVQADGSSKFFKSDGKKWVEQSSGATEQAAGKKASSTTAAPDPEDPTVSTTDNAGEALEDPRKSANKGIMETLERDKNRRIIK